MQPLRTLPKAVLHDHIDGGLRVETVVELAADAGYDGLPTTDPSELAAWFFQGGSGSLEAYLEAFRHTVAVLQTPEGLERATFEAVEDLAADGVVYAELRFGPSLHMQRGMHREDAIAAVLAGVKRGREQTGMSAWVIVTALRQEDDSYEVARAAARFLGEGVVGFDLAGPEAGHPADAHLAACRHARESGLALTVHGGEGDGPESIWRAVTRCGAQRVGHGVRIIEDTVVADGTIVKLGALARSIRDQRIPLEVAVTSNLHTGIAPDARSHPFGLLRDAGFAVTVNTDNRLMSRITLTDELTLVRDTFSLSMADLGELQIAAVVAGFGDWPERRRIIDGVLRPAYAVRAP